MPEASTEQHTPFFHRTTPTSLPPEVVISKYRRNATREHDTEDHTKVMNQTTHTLPPPENNAPDDHPEGNAEERSHPTAEQYRRNHTSTMLKNNVPDNRLSEGRTKVQSTGSSSPKDHSEGQHTGLSHPMDKAEEINQTTPTS
ncbi:hypothetical protein Tco_0989611 [Tanacetum coccineum]|uniref:Uncharacterized protein n=1 Tax=Tanacetum coccineum TaxID=301880 RepID=A0ABQ5EUI8_9ASTR